MATIASLSLWIANGVNDPLRVKLPAELSCESSKGMDLEVEFKINKRQLSPSLLTYGLRVMYQYINVIYLTVKLRMKLRFMQSTKLRIENQVES